jgi:hypothetical protein
MSRKLGVTLLGVCVSVMSVAFLESEANAGCATIGGKRICAAWITGSNIDTISVNGIGNTPGQILAAVGGTVSTAGSNPNCNETSSNFPTEADNCAVEGIAFCINHGGNAAKAQGQPFRLEAVLQGTALFQSCVRNGKCTGSVTLDATDQQVVCQNPNWQLLTFTATKYKGKSQHCTTSWNLAVDPPQCIDGGEVRTLVESCTIDPNTVKPTGGQPITCVPLP